MKPRLIVITSVMLVFLAAGTALAAANRNFRTHLAGRSEVPVRDTQAQGQAIFQLSKEGNALEYKLMVANIENVVASHIHLGPVGANGPVVVFLAGPFAPGGGRIDGVLAEGTITNASTFLNQEATEITSLEDLINAIEAGNTYVNVHTNDGIDPGNTGPGDFPGGEIRGQIQ